MGREIVTQADVEKNSRSFIQTLLDSKKLPVHIKTVEEAFTVAQMGKELGFPTMQAFHYIIPIQGRLSLSAKAVGAVLRKGGVRFTTKEDGVFLYKGGRTEREGDEQPTDRRTTIVFDRDGQIEETSFTWNDAKGMGLTTKDNWVRMPKEMLYARCLAKGANRIGQDLLMGLYVTEELFDALPIKEEDVLRDTEDGAIVEILNTGSETK